MTSDDFVFLIPGINMFFVLCGNSESVHEKCHAMNIQEAKKIRLVDFLGGLGHHPVIQRGNSVWYKSPFRMEKEASFKIDLRKELWYDFGLGKGGDIITLAKEIYQTNDISLVLRYIEDKKAVLKPVTISCPVEEAAPAFQELKIRPLANRILLAYLKERCIDVETARKICRETSFKRNGKNYFAIAFPNISGGYEVRNRFFKACISPKDITCVTNGQEMGRCYVFEGFMDYLSFLTLRLENCPKYPELDRQDYMVLNSVANVSKALYPLGSYERIYCFFDNDSAGMEALQQIRVEYGRDLYIRDASQTYSGCKDLNEYLQKQTERKRQAQSAKETHSRPPKKKNGFRL